MLNKIINTIDAYLTTNADVLDMKQKAELKAQIAYLKAINDDEYVDLKKQINTLRKLLFKILSEQNNGTEDIKLSRKDFLEVYYQANKYVCDCDDNYAEDALEETGLYGKDMTVHWNGIYCNCTDGAVIANYLIPAIKDIDEEEDYE